MNSARADIEPEDRSVSALFLLLSNGQQMDIRGIAAGGSERAKPFTGTEYRGLSLLGQQKKEIVVSELQKLDKYVKDLGKGKAFDKGRRVSVSCDEPQWVHTDGEVACKAKGLDISVLPEQISLFMQDFLRWIVNN